MEITGRKIVEVLRNFELLDEDWIPSVFYLQVMPVDENNAVLKRKVR